MTQELELNKTIGKNIRKYRLIYSATHSKLPQRELASRIGVTTALIGLLESENSTQGIGIYNLYKISKVLEVPIDKFFE